MSKHAQQLREEIQEAGILAFNPPHGEITYHDLLSGAQGPVRVGGLLFNTRSFRVQVLIRTAVHTFKLWSLSFQLLKILTTNPILVALMIFISWFSVRSCHGIVDVQISIFLSTFHTKYLFFKASSSSTESCFWGQEWTSKCSRLAQENKVTKWSFENKWRLFVKMM